MLRKIPGRQTIRIHLIPGVLSALIFSIHLSGCGNDDEKNGNIARNNQTIALLSPEFNADSAFNFIAKQLSFGPRVPNTSSHETCGFWLTGKLKSYTPSVHVQTLNITAHDGKNLRGKNIIATFNPGAKNRIMISAHWDSRPVADKDPDPLRHSEAVPGANDGGSGVAVILEIARQIALKPPAVGVDLMLWDLEDYGDENTEDSYGLGSQYWSKNLHQPGYKPKYGINLDMVGAAAAQFAREGYSDYHATEVVSNVWNIAAQLGYQNVFVNVQGRPVIDDHMYVNKIAKIPCIDIIDQDPNSGRFFTHWHTATDDMESISIPTLKAAGQTILEAIYREKAR